MVKFLESSTIGKNNGVIPSHGGRAGAFVGWVPPGNASGVVACGPSGVCHCQGPHDADNKVMFEMVNCSSRGLYLVPTITPEVAATMRSLDLSNNNLGIVTEHMLPRSMPNLRHVDLSAGEGESPAILPSTFSGAPNLAFLGYDTTSPSWVITADTGGGEEGRDSGGKDDEDDKDGEDGEGGGVSLGDTLTADAASYFPDVCCLPSPTTMTVLPGPLFGSSPSLARGGDAFLCRYDDRGEANDMVLLPHRRYADPFTTGEGILREVSKSNTCGRVVSAQSCGVECAATRDCNYFAFDGRSGNVEGLCYLLVHLPLEATAPSATASSVPTLNWTLSNGHEWTSGYPTATLRPQMIVFPPDLVLRETVRDVNRLFRGVNRFYVPPFRKTHLYMLCRKR